MSRKISLGREWRKCYFACNVRIFLWRVTGIWTVDEAIGQFMARAATLRHPMVVSHWVGEQDQRIGYKSKGTRRGESWQQESNCAAITKLSRTGEGKRAHARFGVENTIFRSAHKTLFISSHAIVQYKLPAI